MACCPAIAPQTELPPPEPAMTLPEPCDPEFPTEFLGFHGHHLVRPPSARVIPFRPRRKA